MIKQHYTGNSRRAMNIIWNAAQDYGWDSPFLAFHTNGTPDDYLNMVIGLTAKWLDRVRITDFFECLGEGPTIDEASVLLWLGLENCVYGKELPERPVIRQMRQKRAQEFFEVSGMLSEQQMSLMSIRVYDQEAYRWSKVLGRRVPALGPRAAKLAEALAFSPAWDTDEVLARMHQILGEFFHISLNDGVRRRKGFKGGFLKKLAEPFARRQERQADLLILRKGSGSGDAKRSVHLTHNIGELHTSADSAADRSYIAQAFGPCMYTDAEMRILEGSLCSGDDALCHLWFTDESKRRLFETPIITDEGKRRFSETPIITGEGKKNIPESSLAADESKHFSETPPAVNETDKRFSQAPADMDEGQRMNEAAPSAAGMGENAAQKMPRFLKDAERLRKDQAAQRRRNEEYYRKNQFRILESIRNLSAQTDVIFQSFLRRLPASAKQGKLVGEKAWRISVLGDGRTFQTDSDVSDATVCVDLLLDASQSRMNSQEMIACQALVIARSFEESHIPVRVTAFRSLRGYTVLQRLKEFGDRKGDGIFSYYAGGWNRDALCLKTMEYLLAEEKKQGTYENRILLVLTDANPNDSVQIPAESGRLLGREYEGEIPVRDAAKAVRMLTQDGVHTGALYYGSSSHLDQVHQIYGQMYVRIKTIGQLPDAVSELLRRSLAKMTGL